MEDTTFLAKVKESWDALILLQKTTWEEFNNSKGNPVMRNKYLNLNLRINEDIMTVLDSLRYIGELYPMQDSYVERRKLFSQRKYENENSSFQNKSDYDGMQTYNKTF